MVEALISPSGRYKCRGRDCGDRTGPKRFEGVDDEFSARWPMCPPCQQAARVSKATCEYCDNRAAHETESGMLCDDHYDHYLNAYRPRN